MTASGEIAKGILIFCCGYYLLMAIGQAISGQTALAAFMLVGFLIPLSIVTHGYVKDKRKIGKPQ
jgi:hypothetical protein